MYKRGALMDQNENKNVEFGGSGIKRMTPYRIFCLVVLIILAILFTFPLYWIITGAFKTPAEINATSPVWFPSEWVMTNFTKLFTKQKFPLYKGK